MWCDPHYIKDKAPKQGCQGANGARWPDYELFKTTLRSQVPCNNARYPAETQYGMHTDRT